MWQLAAMAGMNLLQGVMSQRAANKAAEAENQAIMAANTKNTIRTAARAALLKAQLAVAAKQQSQARADLNKQVLQASGSAAANAAASGTVGASVAAVQNEIDVAASDAEARLDAEWATEQENSLQALADTTTAGLDSLQSGRKVASVGSQALGLLLNTAANTATTYFTAKMNLGLGSANGSTTKPAG